MPFLPEMSDIDIEMIKILIIKEKKEQNAQKNAQKRPYLQIPAPNMPYIPKIYPTTDEKEEEDGAIIIDL